MLATLAAKQGSLKDLVALLAAGEMYRGIFLYEGYRFLVLKGPRVQDSPRCVRARNNILVAGEASRRDLHPRVRGSRRCRFALDEALNSLLLLLVVLVLVLV